jgi:hypothetical protein
VVVVRTAEGGAHAADQLVGGQQAGRLGHAALAVQPLRFDRVEPGALGRQIAAHDADASARPPDAAVVRPEPQPLLDPGTPGQGWPFGILIWGLGAAFGSALGAFAPVRTAPIPLKRPAWSLTTLVLAPPQAPSYCPGWARPQLSIGRISQERTRPLNWDIANG